MPNPKLYNTLAIICGIWFLLFSPMWPYFANLVLGFPVGLLGMFFWNKGRKIDPNNKANKVALIIHLAGVVISIVSLVLLALFN